MMQKSALIAAIVLFAGGAAFGDTSSYSATLAQPVAQKKGFIINGNLYRCEGSTCVLTSHPIDAGSLHSCRALHREVGPLTAYVAGGKPFDADMLAKCNAP